MFIKNNLWILIILILAFTAGIIGINYNLPLSNTVGDEIVITSGALKMLAEKTPVLSFAHSNYFPLSYYIYIPFLIVYVFYLKLFGPFHTFAKIKELGILHTGNFLIVGRILSVLFETASVFLVYLIAMKLFKDKKTSLIASLLFALSPLNALMSHFARVWTIQIFFILLAVYFALNFFSANVLKVNWRKFFLLGGLLGAAFAAHVIGLLVYIPVMALVYFSFESNRLKNFLNFLRTKNFFILNLTIALIIVSTYFLNKTSFVNFFNGFIGNVAHGDNVFQVSFGEKAVYYFKVLFKYETALLILAVPAFWLAYKKNKKAFYFLLAGFLSFFVFFGPLAGFTQARYAMPMIPFLALGAAYFIGHVWDKKGKIAAISLLAATVFPGAFLAYKTDKILTKNSSDFYAYDWAVKNIPNGSKILFINNYFMQDIVLTKDSISRIKAYSPDFYSSRMEYLLGVKENEYPIPSYDIYQDTVICKWPKKEIMAAEFDYIFASEGILKEVTASSYLNLCDLRKINLKERKIVYESGDKTFFDSDYSYQKKDHLLEALEYFNGVIKLGPKVIIYK